MKTKLLRILLLIVLTITGMIMSSESLWADEPTITSESMPVISSSTELPSSSYLMREKRSIASTTETASLSAPMRRFTTLSSSTSWEDPYLPGAEGEWSNPGNVGAPVGDATWPILVSILILYMIFRGVTVSRRRNNL